MKTDIILAGVGGQGILSIATIIGSAALEQGLYLKQAEVHGMSQRGGDVQSNLRLSSAPIFSDLIPKGSADLIVSLEPMEALRYVPWLAPDGWIITNTTPLVNIPNYPEMDKVMEELNRFPQVLALDVDSIAKDLGNARGANMVLLGAMSAALHILDPEKLREGIRRIFGRKGEAVVASNIKAFDEGLFRFQNRK